MPKILRVGLITISILLIIISIFIFGSWATRSPLHVAVVQPSVTTVPSVLGRQTSAVHLYPVTRVIDGDTIEVDNNGAPMKVRYVGVDTPETVDPRRPVGCFGKEASDEDKKLLEGKSVRLEKDVSDTDHFGRWLRFVYLPLPDGTELFVNDYLVREGFARVDTIKPDISLVARFTAAQTEAQSNLRGLWSPSTCNGKK